MSLLVCPSLFPGEIMEFELHLDCSVSYISVPVLKLQVQEIVRIIDLGTGGFVSFNCEIVIGLSSRVSLYLFYFYEHVGAPSVQTALSCNKSLRQKL